LAISSYARRGYFARGAPASHATGAVAFSEATPHLPARSPEIALWRDYLEGAIHRYSIELTHYDRKFILLFHFDAWPRMCVQASKKYRPLLSARLMRRRHIRHMVRFFWRSFPRFAKASPSSRCRFDLISTAAGPPLIATSARLHFFDDFRHYVRRFCSISRAPQLGAIKRRARDI
jgi:hypothetical protein